MTSYKLLTFPLLAMIVMSLFIFVPQSVSADSFFQLLPTPTGSCPLDPSTGNRREQNVAPLVNTRPDLGGTQPFKCENGLCTGSGAIRGGDPLPCNYSLCDFLQLFVNGMNMIVTISASIALIILLWGAQGFIMAMGAEEKITESKGLIKNAVIGLVIILVSWQLIAILIQFLVPNFSTLKDETQFAWNLSGNVRDLCTYKPSR